jgi:hypothetical protein
LRKRDVIVDNDIVVITAVLVEQPCRPVTSVPASSEFSGPHGEQADSREAET